VRMKWIVGSVLLLGAAGAGWFFTRPKEAPAEYRANRVERGSISATITATGTLKPVTMVQVGSQVSGTIQSLHADFNSTVKRGQVIAQLDPSIFRTQLAQNEANLTRAEVNEKDAERTFKRTQELLSRNLVSQAEVDAAEAAYDRSRAEVKQARATIEQSRVNLAHTTISSPIDGVVVSRNVDVGQTVAASLSAPVLFEIANDLTAMQVEASVDEADIGRVAEGQRVSFTVDAYPEDTFTGTVAQLRLQPITVQNVVTYTTVIAVSNPELKLRPGLTANVSIEVARRDDVLKLPAAALSFRPASAAPSGGRSRPGNGGEAASPGAARAAGRPGGGGQPGGGGGNVGSGQPGGGGQSGGAPGRAGRGAQGPTVWVLEAGGKLRPVVVTPGITDGYFTEVVAGELKEGDEVVVGLASQRAQAGGNGGTRNPMTSRRGFF
jgi:HlyD family secretion protein